MKLRKQKPSKRVEAGMISGPGHAAQARGVAASKLAQGMGGGGVKPPSEIVSHPYKPLSQPKKKGERLVVEKKYPKGAVIGGKKSRVVKSRQLQTGQMVGEIGSALKKGDINPHGVVRERKGSRLDKQPPRRVRKVTPRGVL